MKKSSILFILTISGWIVFGGTTIFPGNTAFSAPDGANLYAVNCGACHAKGGNIINPALTVTGSAKMKSLAIFTAYNRNPLKADGSKGVMPAVPKDKISDQEMNLIYEYYLTLKGTKK
jgi:mono/diheme cytochrome c family protein